jgi:hypothetical protein
MPPAQSMQSAFKQQNCKLVDDSVVEQCSSLAARFKLKPEDLANKYDEYLFG